MLEVVDFNESVRDLRRFLDENEIFVPFELADYIEPGDIIEVYSEDFVQMYRNKTLEKICSYETEILETQPFHLLFRRDPEVTKQLVEKSISCMKNQKTIGKIDVEPHYMQEHFATHSKVFLIEHKWCSPLLSKNTNQVLGFFCSQTARRIEDNNVVGIGTSVINRPLDL